MQIPEGGGKSFLKDLDTAQIMLLQGYISGILFADSAGITTFEKNLKIEKNLERCFEVPYYFYGFSRAEALERVIECFSPMNAGGRINLIQFDITDKCNLNCALCSHFSPLVKEENKYSVEQFTKDVWRLRELTEHVENIGLWGGEALLHLQLDELVNISREAFPKTAIEVGTNGILIPSLSDRILTAIKENNCTVRISGYPPTMKMVDKIEKKLSEKGLKYRVVPVESFFKRYELQGDHDAASRHSGCGSKVCHVVKNGTYSSCYFPYGAQVFNQYFEEKFDIDKSIFDLYDDELDMALFTDRIKGGLDICRFCGDIKMYQWKTVGEDKDNVSSWINRYADYIKDLDEKSQNQIDDRKHHGIGKFLSFFAGDRESNVKR